jgi:hypothetical protein
MRRRACFVVTAVASSVSLSAPALSRADDVLDQAQTVTAVSSYGDAQAWSRLAPTPGFELVLRVGTTITVAPIQLRGVPFDVDLGHDGNGRLTAVYSRCKREPDYGAGGIPTANGEGCRLFALDVLAGSERRLRRPARGSSEFLPTISGRRVAFARTSGGRRLPRIYLSQPGRRLLRLPGGRRGVGSAMATRLDLARGRLAIGWQRLAKRGADPGEVGPGPNLVTSVLVDSVRGRQTVVEEIRSGERGRRLALPSLWRGTVYYGIGRELRSYKPGSRQREPIAGPGAAFSIAASGLGITYSMFAYGGRGLDCRTTFGSCRVAFRAR